MHAFGHINRYEVTCRLSLTVIFLLGSEKKKNIALRVHPPSKISKPFLKKVDELVTITNGENKSGSSELKWPKWKRASSAAEHINANFLASTNQLWYKSVKVHGF